MKTLWLKLTATAYYYLGQAMHPVMDSTSPTHEGFQIWDGTGILEHLWGEKRATPESRRRASRRMQLLMDTIYPWLD